MHHRLDNEFRGLEDVMRFNFVSCTDHLSSLPQNSFFFMNTETFEEIPVSEKVVDDRAKWISEGGEVTLVTFKDKVIEVVVPSPQIFEIVQTVRKRLGLTDCILHYVKHFTFLDLTFLLILRTLT